MDEMKFTAVVEADGVIRVPRHILEAAGMCEGAEISVYLTQDGIAASRVQDHDPDQWWFWTPEWQLKEHEVEVDRRNHVPSTFYSSDDEFIAHLNELHEEALRQGR
jgi:hypothetical protein